MTADHTEITTSDRGFAHMPLIPSEYGGHAPVWESSAADGPRLWLRAHECMYGQPPADAAVHLTAEDAWRLSDQLRALVRNHYQGDATPEWVERQDAAPAERSDAPDEAIRLLEYALFLRAHGEHA